MSKKHQSVTSSKSTGTDHFDTAILERLTGSAAETSSTGTESIDFGVGMSGLPKWKAEYPFRLKLIVVVLLVAFLPLVGYFYLDYVLLPGFINNITERSLQTAAQDTAADISAFLDDNLELVRQAGEWSEFAAYLEPSQAGSNTPAEVETSLQRLAQQLDSNSVALLDAQGTNRLDTVEDNMGQNEAEGVYFSDVLEAEQSLITPLLFEPTEAAFYVSAPVKNELGEIVGVLRARYPADVLQSLIEQQQHLAGINSAPMLVDENGLILANGVDTDVKFVPLAPLAADKLAQLQENQLAPEALTSESAAGLASFAEDLQQARSTLSFPTQFEEERAWQAAYRDIRPQSWRVVFLQPQDGLASFVRERFFTLTVILLVLGIVIFFAALNLTKYLTDPLLRLADIARQVAGGAFGLHVPVESRDEVGLVAYAFNRIIGQMRDLTGNIDQIISERTQALGNIVRSLETSTKIGRQITTILDTDELLRQVVNRIQIEFNFYYTHIYLVDEDTGDLVMAQGSGEVGRRLKAQGHRLRAGDGIVGTVASSNEFFLSNDVSKVLNFVPNEELPETRSELALPLRKGDRVLGVLDIQDDEVNRFTSADISLMQSIANQTAIAIDNARLLAETQAALKQVERLNRRLTREGWDQFEADIETPGYRFVRGTSMPLTPEIDAWLPPMRQAAVQNKLVKQVRPNGDGGKPSESELAVPLILRGEVIGVLGVKREEISDWGEEEVAAVEAVANQVTLALENARLSKEQEKTILQLKEVDRLKDEFLTSMSHELRTPLNSIIGFADVILQGIDGEVNEMALNDVRLIHNSGKHLLALINDVLDLAKIEAGKMELVREELNLDAIVDDVMASTSALVVNKPVEMIKEVEDDLPDIYADETRFKQVLINLVSNASKFTEEGQVIIRARRYAEDPDNFALISVIDTGIGIPAAMVEKVFDRFGQVESVKTRKVGGTGLGLPICKQLVEMHGGTISVTSEEDVGSTFYFTIPFAGAELAEDTTAEIEKLLDATKRL